jgi:hypothetical protein
MVDKRQKNQLELAFTAGGRVKPEVLTARAPNWPWEI